MDRPIAIFDSGVGGLTVMREVANLLPGEHIVYFGDTARVPYGIKGKDTIIRFARENVRFLMGYDPKLVVVACNTASAVALPALREALEVTVLGVVEPSAAVAAETTRSGRIAVLATETTVASGAYVRAIHEHKPEAEVFQKACPLLVPMVEEGRTDTDRVVELVLEEYLGPARSFGPDVVVLGCTHYPMLAEGVGRGMGRGVRVVDSARATALEVAVVLNQSGLVRKEKRGHYRFLVTDNPQRFETIGRRFMGERVTAVELVDPEQFFAAVEGKR